MKLRPLIIDAQVRSQIAQAVAKARTKTTPWEKLRAFAEPETKTEITLADKAAMPGVEELMGRSENVLIPNGYRAAISFEEQPAGIVRHLSVSVDKPGKLPSVESVGVILEEFGFDPLNRGTSEIWLEEFDPGHQAVNVAQIDSKRKAGQA